MPVLQDTVSSQIFEISNIMIELCKHFTVVSCYVIWACIVPIINGENIINNKKLSWLRRTSCPISGVHHPITFANETHGFLLTGTTEESTTSSIFYMYDESTDTWTDLTKSFSAFPGLGRSFGYGVVLAQTNSTKAYIGFGADSNGARLSDLWEFDMSTHSWTELPNCPCIGRRHPAMIAVRDISTSSSSSTTTTTSNNWQIHVGLGDTRTDEDGFSNLNDWWSFDIASNTWSQLPDLPADPRHHPFYFSINGTSYAGLGHASGYIARDWFSLNTENGNNANWVEETYLESYEVTNNNNNNNLITTEARVAGTQFSIEFPLVEEGGSTSSSNSDKNDEIIKMHGSLGFILSGDGDNHGTMQTGEFIAFYPKGNTLLDGPNGPDVSWWRQLPPHPGFSRWAPGSFVIRGTARAYFIGGYDRTLRTLFNDVWMIDLSLLFMEHNNTNTNIEIGDSSSKEEDDTSLDTTTTTTTTANAAEQEFTSKGHRHHDYILHFAVISICFALAWSI